MPNRVVLTWFPSWSLSLVIFLDQLPSGESPQGAKTFLMMHLCSTHLVVTWWVPSYYISITPMICLQTLVWIIVLLLHLEEHFFLVPI
jgi:hypothetical protein